MDDGYLSKTEKLHDPGEFETLFTKLRGRGGLRRSRVIVELRDTPD